jgi:hypothetical protein
MLARMRFFLFSVVLIGCGGRVLAEPDAEPIVINESDAAATPAADTSPPSTDPGGFKPPTEEDAAPSPPPDTKAPVTDSSPIAVTCDEGPATGAPGSCTAALGCKVGDSLEYASAKIACYVDRCAIEKTGKPWCGTLMLKLNGDGCTMDYREDGPGLGGCVKYQGAYRGWPCVAGQTITITRPCP